MRLSLVLWVFVLAALAMPVTADRVDDTIWDLLYGGTPDVRASAAVTLGRVNDSRAVEPLIEALKDEYEDVRCAAVDALGRIGGPRAVEALIDIVSSPHVYTEVVVSTTLFGRELTESRLENREVRPRAVAALIEIGELAVEPLIDALGNEDSRVREDAAEALGKIGDPRAVAPLTEALNDENSRVRLNAAEALGRIGDPRAVASLIEALNDEDSGVRLEAIWALGEIGDPRAVAPLMKVKNDSTGLSPPGGDSQTLTAADVEYFMRGSIRDEAVEALKKIEAAEALRTISDPLSSLSPEATEVSGATALVQEAAEASENIENRDFLIEALKDENWWVRCNAARSLGEIGDPRAVDPLIEALEDEEPEVREAAAVALGEIGDPKAIEPLTYLASNDAHAWVREAAADALEKIQAE